MKYEAVLFDLDGTLIDTLNDIGDAANRVLSNRGFRLLKELKENGARAIIDEPIQLLDLMKV